MKREPQLHTRRSFLGTGALGGALACTVPTFLANTFASLHAGAADAAIQTATGKDSPILVVLQMAGGNDGLNTVVPFTNDHYHKARPRLGLAPDKVLKLDEHFGLHPAMTPFKSLFDEGSLGIIQGIGYPNPNRSHFRSTEIWQTASDAQRFERYGWIGRYFDNACKGADPTVGVSVGRQMPQAFAARKPLGVSLENPENYRFMSKDKPEKGEMGSAEDFFKQLNKSEDMAMEKPAISGSSIGSISGQVSTNLAALDYLERTALDAQLSSEKIRAVSNKVQNQATYPQNALANNLKLVARLIGGGLPTRIYYVSQGGYDTHTNQANTQERLLTDMTAAVGAFVEDLRKQGNFQRVLLMTFSEFGRRVRENANNGTDHGAAAPMFVIGSKVKAGFLGAAPSLAPADLVNGDVKFTTDFRSVYAGILQQWLNAPVAPVLGRPFEPLQVV